MMSDVKEDEETSKIETTEPVESEQRDDKEGQSGVENQTDQQEGGTNKDENGNAEPSASKGVAASEVILSQEQKEQNVDYSRIPSSDSEQQKKGDDQSDNLDQQTSEPKKIASEQDAKAPNPNLRSETSQHRHNVGTDKPSSYQSSPPSTYLQIRALALQLPNSTANANSHSNGHHIDPPTLILEARTNMSTARRSFYPRVTRTLPEMQLWILALTLSFPAGIFSPFQSPPPALVVGGSMEDSVIRGYLSTITHQFARILRKPFVLSHPATVALIDSDFNYNPSVPHVGPGSSVSARKKLEDGISIARMGHDPLLGRKGKGGSGISPTATWDVDGVSAALGLPGLSTQASGDIYSGNTPTPSTSKNPLSIFSRANASPQRIQPHPQIAIPPGEEDEDEEELTAARNEITRLELQFEKASKAAQMMVDRSGAMTATLYQLNTALMDLARLDEGRTIARKAKESEDMTILTKGIESWAAAQTGSNLAVLGTIVPSMSYQSLNARAAIDALLRRAAAASHRYQTLIVLVQKRREAERMKRARGEIRQEDVDWILQELRDAQRTTSVLTHHLSTFTTTLKEELKEHSRNTHTDIQDALINHARNSMRAHKYILNNLVRARDGLVAIREGRSLDQTIVPPLVAPVRDDPLPSANAAAAADREADSIAAAQASEQLRSSNGHSVDTTAISRPADLEPVKPADVQVSPDVPVIEPVRTPSSAISSASVNKDLPDAPPSTEREGEASQLPTSAAVENVKEPSLSLEREPQLDKGVDVSQTSLPAEISSQWNTNNDTSEPLSAPSSGRGGGNMAQSTFLPQPSSRQSSKNFGGVPNSPFASDATQPPNTAPASSASSMSQSAFLSSGRDMNRYANPFARMDGGGGGVNGNPNFNQPSQFGNRQGFGQQQTQPNSGNSNDGNANESGKKPGDVWANRSRISASDAARSLAGRF